MLIASGAAAVPCESVAEWWPRHRSIAAEHPATIHQAIVGGFVADRVGWAFAPGCQAAVLSYLMREGQRLSWPQHWLERLSALLAALGKLSYMPASHAETHIALAGALAIGANKYHIKHVKAGLSCGITWSLPACVGPKAHVSVQRQVKAKHP